MTKRLLASLIAIFVVFTTMSGASAAPLFNDVGDNYGTRAELDYLAKRGIIVADPTVNFGVNEEISRLEAAEMIIKALGLEMDNRPTLNFTDVTVEDEGYSIISTIVGAGIMGGNADGEFKPYDKLTRGQMASILVTAFQLEGTSPNVFRDVDSIYWASEAINTLYANEITTGYSNNTYKPTAFITKANFATFLARILNPDFKQAKVCYGSDDKKKHMVNVQVTTLWNQLDKNRVIDRPSLTSPTDIEKWAKSLSISQKQWLVGKIDTQALYGQEVEILKSSGNWHQIAVKDQYVPHNKAGYPGWVPKSHITEVNLNTNDCPIAIVEAPIAKLYTEPKLSDKYKFMDISYTTIMPVIQEDKDWVQVQTPANGVKYIRQQDVKLFNNYAAVPKPTQKDIVDSAKKFLGLPYLWAGTSGFGFDCSGIMHSVYKNHGIIIPRDSFVQATHGTAVAKKNMQPGDLMFFAYNGGKGKVYHVGMYIGDGKMLHAPNSSRKVEIIPVDTGIYKTNYSGARRYLQ